MVVVSKPTMIRIGGINAINGTGNAFVSLSIQTIKSDKKMPYAVYFMYLQ